MRHRIEYLWSALMLVFILQGCHQPSANITDKLGNKPEMQQVCRNTDRSLDYNYYLPKGYNGVEKLPVLFFLDPHADSKTPMETYHELANTYNYIFIGSNTIRNGLSAVTTAATFDSLVAEATNRFEIDKNRMYVAGFSGGAKLAMLIAQQKKEIIGVIACGGSIPLGGTAPNFYLAGIVGNTDFNFLEMQQAYTAFGQNGIDYTSVVFDGGHQWPDINSFEMGFIGFNLFAIKSKRVDRDNEWLDVVWNRMQDSINSLAEQEDVENQNRYINQAIRWFYGLRNTTELSQLSRQIENSAAFTQMAQKRQKLIQSEVKLRSEYIRAIELKDLNWWTGELKSINANVDGGDKEVALVSKRLLNYLSMACFMLAKTDLDDSKIDESFKKISIYKMVDPNNPDVYLMLARYYMIAGDTNNMKQNFLKAKSLGFNQFETYKNEKSWTKLFTNLEIVAMQ